MLSHPRSALLAGAFLLPLTAAGGYAAGAAQQPPQATRTVLAQAVDPPGAHGRTLALARVTIPPTRGSACIAIPASNSHTSRRAR